MTETQEKYVTVDRFETAMERMDKRFDRLESKMATKDDLKAHATKDDLRAYATKDDLKTLATKDELKALATKDDIKALESKMMEGFEIVFGRLESVEEKIDDLTITKVDKEEFMPLYKRVTKLEKKCV